MAKTSRKIPTPSSNCLTRLCQTLEYSFSAIPKPMLLTTKNAAQCVMLGVTVRRCRKTLSIGASVTKIGVDIAENGPSEVELLGGN